MREPAAWQGIAADALSSPAALLQALHLDPALPALQYEALRDFPLRVPRGFVARMRAGDANDPLFLQVWPAARESETTAGFRWDAVGELTARRGAGLIQKYQGRVLLIATGACAVHCRYCFRRHYPYHEDRAARGAWHEVLAALHADDSIEEVILSGGDPLSLHDDKLAVLAEGLNAIPHLRRLRIHTRLPIVIPERVDAALLAWLRSTRLQTIVVVHANHANEIDAAVGAALQRLRAGGVHLLNQAVLLKNINDSVQAQRKLAETLFTAGVLPYYLHMLDEVQGAGHFAVDETRAVSIMRELNAELPGYLVPRLVREIAGAAGKTPVRWQD